MNPHADTLHAIKQKFPFDNWRAYWREPDEQAECDAVEQAFDELLADLIELGPNATEAQKIACFQKAIETTNDHAEVIETTEREDLCELTNDTTVACGLDPDAYGDGEGLASEWRDW